MYVIININKLIIATSIHQTNHIYVAGLHIQHHNNHTEEKFLYAGNIVDAKTFETEQEAWFYIYDFYGMDYGKRTFIVASIKDDAIKNLSRIKLGETNG